MHKIKDSAFQRCGHEDFQGYSLCESLNNYILRLWIMYFLNTFLALWDVSNNSLLRSKIMWVKCKSLPWEDLRHDWNWWIFRKVILKPLGKQGALKWPNRRGSGQLPFPFIDYDWDSNGKKKPQEPPWICLALCQLQDVDLVLIPILPNLQWDVNIKTYLK